MQRLYPWLAAAVAAFALALPPMQAAALETHPLIGQTVPGVPMTDSHDRQVTLRSRGKPMVVLFWTTWCGRCASALRVTREVEQRYAASVNVRLINVAVSESGRASIAQFLDQNRVQSSVYLDTLGEAADRWHVRAVPALYFVAGDGKVTGVLEGADIVRTQVQAQVVRLLGGDGVRSSVHWKTPGVSSTRH